MQQLVRDINETEQREGISTKVCERGAKCRKSGLLQRIKRGVHAQLSTSLIEACCCKSSRAYFIEQHDSLERFTATSYPSNSHALNRSILSTSKLTLSLTDMHSFYFVDSLCIPLSFLLFAYLSYNLSFCLHISRYPSLSVVSDCFFPLFFSISAMCEFCSLHYCITMRWILLMPSSRRQLNSQHKVNDNCGVKSVIWSVSLDVFV